MSEEYQKYEAGEPVIYTNGDKNELGIVKKVCGGDEYFVNYHTGDTAARTHARHLSKISNRYAYHIFRLDPDGNERKKIVGTTTVDKSFERLLLDNCPEVKKKLEAFEIIKKHAREIKHFKYLLYMAKYWEENEVEVTKELLENYDFPYTVDEFNFLKEVME